MLHDQLLLAVSLACPLTARADEVTLRLENLRSDAAGAKIGRALDQLPGVNVLETATKDRPILRVSFDPSQPDLGELARAVADARPVTRAESATRLVLGYQRFDDSLHKDDEFVPRYVEPALAKLKDKGVDVKDWKLDTKAKEVHIRLDDKGSTKLADIRAAFPAPDSELFPLVAYTIK